MARDIREFEPRAKEERWIDVECARKPRWRLKGGGIAPSLPADVGVGLRLHFIALASTPVVSGLPPL